ncbi:MAG: serine/threonine-protein kinase [Deltaproteobacteria bacterium]|nr:serine/threonine-protein kinase [Deltaproteobacteria bacterium]
MGKVDYSGQTLDGRYRLVKILGQGGMGAVYLGQHIVIGRQVAIKFLHAEFASNPDVVKRFYREAQAAAAIRQRNIIEVMDVGVSPWNEPYLVMEYLEGESLASMLERAGPVDLAVACGVAEPALLALAAAHAQGIVHRDLKPENIFLTCRTGEPPVVKLIDFGVSKFTKSTDATRLTQTGSLLGTPAYMSPEQARGSADVDHRSDLYSMGVILYQMLTGRLPYQGANYNELLINLLTQDPTPPHETNPGFPAEAGPLIKRAMAKSAGDRYQTAHEMIEALKGLRDFAHREEKLSVLASGIERKSYASGDLGSHAEFASSGGVAADILSQVVRQGTPGSWTGTSEQLPAKRTALYVAIAGAAVLVVVGIVAGVLLLGRGSGAAAARPTVAPLAAPVTPADPVPAAPVLAPQLNEGVLVTVKGAPAGAKIFYDDAEVPENPFRVKRAQTLVSVRVEAPGFEKMKVSIVPSEDRTIEAALKPLSAKVSFGGKASGGGKPSGPSGIKKGGKGTEMAVDFDAPPKQAKKKLGKGGRGTEMAVDFE